MVQQVSPQTIRLRGGTLCLDFANSVDWSHTGEPRTPETDALRTPGDLVRWGRRLGLVGRGGRSPGDAELAAACGLRAAAYAVFAAIAEDRAPPQAALDRIARDHAEATGAGELARRDGTWRLRWPPGDPRRVRFAVAEDAVLLLADPDRLARVRRCPGSGCGWLFLDLSGRRKWCSMETCGSRAKMRRLYERRRSLG